jgi:GNAT superfamily N-acetyltransferase
MTSHDTAGRIDLDVYVPPARRRQGIGRRLVDAARAYTRDEDRQLSVEVHSRTSERFYANWDHELHIRYER